MVAFVMMLSSGLFLVGAYFYAHMRRKRLRNLRIRSFIFLAITALMVSGILVTFKYQQGWPGILFGIPAPQVDKWLDEVSIIAAIVIGVLLWIMLLWRIANWVFNLFARRKSSSQPGHGRG